jgi:HSP90 family molecular chaperone
MSTSNNNKTAERLPSSPLAPAERTTPSPLASTDNYLSYPSVQHNNNNYYYTSRDNSPHSQSPHHEGMRDQSLSLHPYSGRDSDSNELMTPMSATNNKTTKSSAISSNRSYNYHSNNSNNNYSQNSNNNTTLTNNNNNTASTISSPPSHPLHHQGSGGSIIYSFLTLIRGNRSRYVIGIITIANSMQSNRTKRY